MKLNIYRHFVLLRIASPNLREKNQRTARNLHSATCTVRKQFLVFDIEVFQIKFFFLNKVPQKKKKLENSAVYLKTCTQQPVTFLCLFFSSAEKSEFRQPGNAISV